MARNRLSKILARAGVASRRKCEALIFEGQVSVNGSQVLEPQFQVDLRHDEICVDGEPITKFEKKVYYILNKPRGYVCSHDAEAYKKIVMDLFPKKERLFTVGRLDKETSGLLVVTNDGQIAHQISHPSFEIEKEYLVKTDREITALDLKRISSGLNIDGSYIIPVSVSKVRKGNLKITVKEGKKHEVRRLVEQTGASVIDLKRIRIGNLFLGLLPEGTHKKISLEELQAGLGL